MNVNTADSTLPAVLNSFFKIMKTQDDDPAPNDHSKPQLHMSFKKKKKMTESRTCRITNQSGKQNHKAK